MKTFIEVPNSSITYTFEYVGNDDRDSWNCLVDIYVGETLIMRRSYPNLDDFPDEENAVYDADQAIEKAHDELAQRLKKALGL